LCRLRYFFLENKS